MMTQTRKVRMERLELAAATPGEPVTPTVQQPQRLLLTNGVLVQIMLEQMTLGSCRVTSRCGQGSVKWCGLVYS